ncbi:hypothetical protein OG196_11640 [Kitasatospora purpeofusca]|uniref:hypothetical protein n=1 Tax=Kitasatospora purpeofusca TaxID=67352 RepID=UPI002E1634D8|nr:hypothetical protein OG196_11640 [Kitasatospora purpeofusca]
MRGIVVRTLVAVVLGTGAWWGGAAAALAADSGPGPAVTAAPGSAHHGTRDGKPADDGKPGNADKPGKPGKPGKLGDLGDLLDLDGRGGNGGGHSDRQCTVTTAWGDSWCPRKPLD